MKLAAKKDKQKIMVDSIGRILRESKHLKTETSATSVNLRAADGRFKFFEVQITVFSFFIKSPTA